MDWVQLMKNKPIQVFLAVATLVFGGSKLTISTDQATIDSLNIEMVKAQKDILVLERDLRQALIDGEGDRKEIRDDMKELKASIDEIRRFLMNQKPQ